MPQYQQMVTLLNGWYNKGLIDPESFTQPDTQAQAKLTSGKSFAIMENAQYVVIDQKAMTARLEPSARSRCRSARRARPWYGSRLDAGLLISAKAAQDPHFVAMLQFIDWLWYSDAGMLFARWGIEGTTYTGSVADGTFQLEPDRRLGRAAPERQDRDQRDVRLLQRRVLRRRLHPADADPVPAGGAGVPEDHGHPHAAAGEPARAADHAAEPARPRRRAPR